MIQYLFNNSTTNGNSSSVVHPGGTLGLIVRGTFGGATVRLQISDDGANWVDINDAFFTAASAQLLIVPGGALLRATITGGTAASLTVALI